MKNSKLGAVRLYDNINVLTELQTKQVAVYNQILHIENDIKKDLVEIDLDRFLDGLNIELEKTWLTKNWKKKTLERMLNGELLNRDILIRYCLSNTRKEKPERFDKKLEIEKLKIQKSNNKNERTPTERSNDIAIQLLLDKKELKEELKKLNILKEKFRKNRGKALYEKIKKQEAVLQSKYL